MYIMYCIYNIPDTVSPTTSSSDMANDISSLARNPNFVGLSGRAPHAFLLSRTHELANILLAFMLIIN